MRPCISKIRKQKHPESGAIVLLCIVLLTAIFALVGLSTLRGAYSLARAQLRTAVDAAAHSAVSNYCSTQACWRSVPSQAIRVFNQYRILGGMGQSQTFNITEPAYDVAAPFAFDAAASAKS